MEKGGGRKERKQRLSLIKGHRDCCLEGEGEGEREGGREGGGRK